MPKVPPAASILFFAGLLLASFAARGEGTVDPRDVLLRVDGYPHLESIERDVDASVRDYLIALGAVQKIRGVWAPRDSERVSGRLTRYTWRLLDGYSAAEVAEGIEAELTAGEGVELLFACDARACGSSVQWANRIFRERLLYGVEKSQRYRAYRMRFDGAEYRVLLYGSARTTDRQYLHAELLVVDEPAA